MRSLNPWYWVQVSPPQTSWWESTDCNALKVFNPITHHFNDDQGNNAAANGQQAPEAAEGEQQAQEHSEEADE